jgi:hypothetical protein
VTAAVILGYAHQYGFPRRHAATAGELVAPWRRHGTGVTFSQVQAGINRFLWRLAWWMATLWAITFCHGDRGDQQHGQYDEGWNQFSHFGISLCE